MVSGVRQYIKMSEPTSSANSPTASMKHCKLNGKFLNNLNWLFLSFVKLSCRVLDLQMLSDIIKDICVAIKFLTDIESYK